MSQTQYPDWTTKTPAGFVNLREGYFSLPVFALSGHTWLGYTELVRQYNYNATTRFVVPTLPSKPSGVTFLLCIRWRVGEVVTRYKMWDDEGTALGLVGAPIYSGQVIPKNFVLEVFTILNETAPALATALTIASTIRTVPVDYRVRGSYEDDAAPTVVTDYEVQMPARGTGHTVLYESESLPAVGAALANWPDLSGNGRALDTPTGTPTTVGPSTLFKNLPYAVFGSGDEIEPSDSGAGYDEIFIACNIQTIVSGDYILSDGSIVVKLLVAVGGEYQLSFNGVTVDIDFPLNTDLLFHVIYKSAGGSNIQIAVNVYGDYEASYSVTLLVGVSPVGLKVHAAASASIVKIAAISGFYQATAAVIDAERDYLITKYIGWTTDLNFNADVAGEDNP